jgi:hypothetical protein
MEMHVFGALCDWDHGLFGLLGLILSDLHDVVHHAPANKGKSQGKVHTGFA